MRMFSDSPKASLDQFTDQALKDELARRSNLANKPKLLENPDFSKLKTICEEYIENYDNDSQHYIFEEAIFEEAMTAFYGKDVFNYLNNR